MSFDTIITVWIAELGTRDEHGEYVPGEAIPYEVWADESGAGSIDTPTEGGLIITSGRTFLVRWFQELAVALDTFVTVTDNLGQTWYSDGIGVSDARQRFIVINAGRTGL